LKDPIRADARPNAVGAARAEVGAIRDYILQSWGGLHVQLHPAIFNGASPFLTGIRHASSDLEFDFYL
jgi:hypothetical protein